MTKHVLLALAAAAGIACAPSAFAQSMSKEKVEQPDAVKKNSMANPEGGKGDSMKRNSMANPNAEKAEAPKRDATAGDKK